MALSQHFAVLQTILCKHSRKKLIKLSLKLVTIGHQPWQDSEIVTSILIRQTSSALRFFFNLLKDRHDTGYPHTALVITIDAILVH